MGSRLLQGKRALVTGGTSGIGLSIARSFAKEGAKVFIVGTNVDKGHQAALQLSASGMVTFIACDVSSKEQVDRLIGELLTAVGGIDILVNNAGITRDGLLMRMSEGDWDEVIDVNLKSCYNTCHAVIRHMIKARSGCIINMSSVVGLSGNAGQSNYAASKAAIIGFTKALAAEVASRSVRVNCIAPGFIETPMTEALSPSQKEEILAKIPLGRMGEPEDIANMALFLASDLGKYITRQVFTVDGGMTG